MGAWLGRTTGLFVLGIWLGALVRVLSAFSLASTGPARPYAAALVLGAGVGLCLHGLAPRALTAARLLALAWWLLLLVPRLAGAPAPFYDAGLSLWPWLVALGAWGLYAGPALLVWPRSAAPVFIGASCGVLANGTGLADREELAVLLGALVVTGLTLALWKRRRAHRERVEPDWITGAEDELVHPLTPAGSAYGRRLVGLLFLALALALGVTAFVWAAAPSALEGPRDPGFGLSLAFLALGVGAWGARVCGRFLRAPLNLDAPLWVTVAALFAVWFAGAVLAWWPAQIELGDWGTRLGVSLPPRFALGVPLACAALGFVAATLLVLCAVWMRGVILIAAAGLCALPRVWLVDVGLAETVLGALGLALVLVFIGGERVAPDVGRVWAPWARRSAAGVRVVLGCLCALAVVLGVAHRDAFAVRLDSADSAGGALVWFDGPVFGSVLPGSRGHDWTADAEVVWRFGRRVPGAQERAAMRAAGLRIASLLGGAERSAEQPLARVDFGFGELASANLLRTDAWRARRAEDPRALWIAWLPLDLDAEEFAAAQRAFAGAFDWSSAWFVDGYAFVVGAAGERPLDLAAGAPARATLAGFVGVLPRAAGGPEAAGGLASAPGPRSGALRRRARNLEAFAASRTPWPMDWTLLVGSTAVDLQRKGRAVLTLHTAAAWVAHGRAETPGSLALESWQLRLLEARADIAGDLADDPSLLAFDRRLKAEEELRLARRELERARPAAAVGLLLSARRVLGERGDLELPLAAALALAGQTEAASITWQNLGPRGPALLASSEAWLTDLGFAP